MLGITNAFRSKGKSWIHVSTASRSPECNTVCCFAPSSSFAILQRAKINLISMDPLQLGPRIPLLDLYADNFSNFASSSTLRDPVIVFHDSFLRVVTSTICLQLYPRKFIIRV